MLWVFNWRGKNVMQRSQEEPQGSSAVESQSQSHDLTQSREQELSSPHGSPPRPPISPITPVKKFAFVASTGPEAFSERPQQLYQQSLQQHHVQQQQAQQQAIHQPSHSHFMSDQSASSLVTTPSQFSPSILPQQPQPDFISQPLPVNLAESDNPDVIALRAAMYVLQVQKEKSKRDMQRLVQLKADLAAEPEAFTKDLLEGRLKHEITSKDALRAILESDTVGSDLETDADMHISGDDDHQKLNEETNSKRDESAGSKDTKESKFGSIPSKQNVVRTPHINWAKYHVIGESLDKMHEEQRVRPNGSEFGQPASGWEASRAPEHVVAAPYSPFQDGHFVDSPTGSVSGAGFGLDSPHPMQTRRGFKRF